MKKILFVCTGNICRSPTAHAIARHKAKILGKQNDYFFDSAGTSGFHQNESTDARAMSVGKQRGVSFDGISSRKITPRDFDDFDFLLCMDRGHLRHLQNLSDKKNLHKIQLFLQFCGTDNDFEDEVTDPYYGGNKGFEKIFDLVDLALENLFEYS